MKRREFLKLGMSGLAAIAMSSTIEIPPIFRTSKVLAQDTPLELSVMEVMHEMVDQTLVYSWAYAHLQENEWMPGIPGPVIFAEAGRPFAISLWNPMNEAHGFAVTNTGDYGEGNKIFEIIVEPDPESETRRKTFEIDLPLAGTYIYFDPVNDPINRVMGLHGVIIVLPPVERDAQDRVIGPTIPYAHAPAGGNVARLFADLGTDVEHFPGETWLPHQTVIWIFNQTDPAWNLKLMHHHPFSPEEFKAGFKPRYFSINGRQGYFAAHEHADHNEIQPEHQLLHRTDHDPATVLASVIGRPMLIRSVNVGLATHSPHPHANHVYQVGVNGNVETNVRRIDTWSLGPMERYDMLYPYIIPPDIPAQTRQLLFNSARGLTPGSQEGRALIGVNPMIKSAPFPMHYPMHCHLELSQTAAGGNYPQGAVVHIEFHGISDKITAIPAEWTV